MAPPRGAGQIAALIDGCDTDTAVEVRDRALLVMLARLGLRTAEAAALQQRPGRS